MRKIPDAASVATAHWVSQLIGRKVECIYGTNLYGVLQLACEMKQRGETGSIVTLLCDSGERYLDTYYDLAWVKRTSVIFNLTSRNLSHSSERLCEPACCGQLPLKMQFNVKKQPAYVRAVLMIGLLFLTRFKRGQLFWRCCWLMVLFPLIISHAVNVRERHQYLNPNRDFQPLLCTIC